MFRFTRGFALLFALALPGMAQSPTLAATTVAEVRTAGAQTNGAFFDFAAGGTDMSIYDNKNAAGCSSCQSATVNISTTDAVTNNTTTVTSATANFSSAINGNGVYLTGSGTTTGWYIATYVSATSITVDRPTGSTGGTGVTINIGGAFKIGGTLDDDFFEIFDPGNKIYIKAGTYTLGEVVSLTAAGSAIAPIQIIGYNSTRGDAPVLSGGVANLPLVNAGSNAIVWGTNWERYNIRFIGTAAALATQGSNNKDINVQYINSSTTANQVAIALGNDGILVGSDAASYRGRAVSMGNTTGTAVIGNYIHASNEGLYSGNSQSFTIVGNVIEDIITHGIYLNAANIQGNTIYANTIAGSPTPRTSSVGVRFATGATDMRLISNIIYGWAIGVQHADTQAVGLDLYNFYYNNTAETDKWQLGTGSVTGTNPSFTAFTRISDGGSLASSSGSTLTSGSGSPFSAVVDGVDFLYASGTGITTGIYPITGHGSNTLTTGISLGTGSNISWEIIQGHNLAIGTALKGLGFPRTWGGYMTNYLDPGAGQRQEAGGSGGTRIY